MNIRLKVVALVALLFAVLIAVEGVVQECVVMPSFVELERSGARTAMTRINYALDRTLERLKLNDLEWSNWAELYRFMQDFNPAFIATYTTAEALVPLKVNLLLLADRDGRVVFAAARDLDSGIPLDLDLAQRSSLPADFPWRRNLQRGVPARGLVRTNLGVMMLAAAPIFDGSGGGKPLGMTLMGRLLTAAQLRDIGTQAQAALTMHTASPESAAPALVEDETTTQVSGSYDDIEGRPLMTLRVDVPRSITKQGRAAILYSTLYLVGAAITILVLLLVVLNRVVLNRVARVTHHAVAREFDRMVGRLADSRRQLADRSFQAGFAELAKGIMHNLGNAMTPLGVRLTLLAGRLRGAPVAEVAAAAAELEGAPAAERRADLTEFVHFGGEEIDTAIQEALDDVAVIERQAAIVSATLAEQKASAGSEQVLESVRLPELLAQTLDIVPDAARRRLLVEADESLRSVGAVTVARTVLRLVLQNLIINAADAVHAAGLHQGALRLTAGIEQGDGRRQLHLECRDNGAGIAAENLQRVFEKGFSTKSRDTNRGIGLHWCANASRSLGGRIWAASDGPGRGASLHVMFPISVDGGLSHGR
jgi:sensor domain CHASE-containing protein